MTKKFKLGLIVAALVLISTGTGIAAEKKLLKMAYAPPVKVWGFMAEKYAEEVAKRSPNLDIKWYGGGQLGSNKQIMAGLKRGKIELQLSDVGTLSMAAGGKPFNVLWAPFLFKSREHQQKYLDSDLFKSMVAETEKAAGFKYIGFIGDRPPRMLTTGNRKVVTPEDLKGLKIRVPMIKAAKTFFEEVGANPTPVSGHELYMALKQGVVDGCENGWQAIVLGQVYEVQKYITTTNYVYQAMIVTASKKVWDKLSKEEQNALIDACAPTAEMVNKDSDTLVVRGEKLAAEKGLEIIEPDMDAFQSVAAKIVKEKLDGNEWPAGLYEKIKALE